MVEWLKYSHIILTIIVLSICVVFDIKYKLIPLLAILSLGINSLLAVVFLYREGWIYHLAGAGVGVVIIMISKITNGSIGEGDGWILVCLGLLLGIRGVIFLLVSSIMLSAIWSGILLVFRKANRKTTFPFVPFLLLSYLIYLQ